MKRDPDAGDTLIEVLLALMVVALGVVALMTGLATSVAGSATHRGLSTTDAVLKSFSESAANQIELQSSPLFAPCAGVSGTSYGTAGSMTPIDYAPPSGFVVFFTGIQYWSTAANGFVDQATCAASPAAVSGNQLQLLTIAVKGPTTTETMSFGVRPQ